MCMITAQLEMLQARLFQIEQVYVYYESDLSAKLLVQLVYRCTREYPEMDLMEI